MINNTFNCFLKPQLKIDTIPKPVGLGSRSWRRWLSVRHLSGTCPAFVRRLSSICPPDIDAWEHTWKTNFKIF
jgi:hypothetical protein